MTVGDFGEVIGTDGFDSIRGEDLSIVYALGDRDNLNSSISSAAENPTTVLVGGSGNNNYIIWDDSTSFVLENGDATNILWTNIGTGSGISLSDDDSFVAEIDDRHLYLGNTETGQSVIVIDWQLPDNQIETFALSEGDLSYAEFASSFRSSSNYRGDLTWAELAETEEIDLDRLGLSPETIDRDFDRINDRSLELSFIASNPLSAFLDEDILESSDGDSLVGDGEDDVLRGGSDNDTIFGGAGDDILYGNAGDDILGSLAVGSDSVSSNSDDGKDTLLGGAGNDIYLMSTSIGGGDVVRDRIDPDDTDILFIASENTQIDTLLDAEPDDYLELATDPQTYGDSTLEIAFPREGRLGMQKLDNHLIIDLNRDGVAEVRNDLTIIDFFDDDGLGLGSMTQINHIIDPQEIADFF